MRIRSIKPDFWSSEDIAALDWHTRLIFIGLWSYVDDNGVGRDSERLIAAALFPLEDDPRESLARVSRGLVGLSEGGQIARYEVGGKGYIHITAWESHQRVDKRGKDRYPLPTRANADIRDTVATPSRESRDTLAPGEGEKGRRGEGEEGESISSEIADAIPRPDAPRPEIDAILDHLEAAVAANGAKKPTRGKRARDAVRLMIDTDGRTPEQIRAAIDFATGDEFWRANILSASKLREKYDQLRMQAQRSNWRRPGDRHERHRQFWEAEAARAMHIDGHTEQADARALEA